jgi:opacity protein-like surface antigen
VGENKAETDEKGGSDWIGTPAVAQSVNPFLGPYAGVHAGYSWGDATFKSAPYTFNTFQGLGFPPARYDSFDLDDVLFGVHGGMNFSFGPNGIFGLEADATNLGGQETASDSFVNVVNDGIGFQYRSALEFDWQSTIRGRVGFVAGRTLFFATAGVAFLNVDWSETASNSCFGCGANPTFVHSKDETLVGGVVGAGAEMAISPTVILGADYLYENFGDINSVPHGAAPGQTGKLDSIDVHKVRVRLSVKFGGPPT